MYKSGDTISLNREAKYNYFIEDTFEAGIELRGNEIHSIRESGVNLKGSWIDIENSEMLIKCMHISPCRYSNKFDIDENRERKLLMHKNEIRTLANKLKLDGYTLVPLKVYINNKGKCKIQVGLCRGKKLYDKRESAKARAMDMEALRASKRV